MLNSGLTDRRGGGREITMTQSGLQGRYQSSVGTGQGGQGALLSLRQHSRSLLSSCNIQLSYPILLSFSYSIFLPFSYSIFLPFSYPIYFYPFIFIKLQSASIFLFFLEDVIVCFLHSTAKLKNLSDIKSKLSCLMRQKKFKCCISNICSN